MEDTLESCELLGVAGLLVQVALGALSFSVLIVKRQGERPRRPWRIWALDTSKQGLSQLNAHLLNVAISLALSTKLQGDACLWYFTTNILDNSLGVFLSLLFLRLLETWCLPPSLHSGNYYKVEGRHYLIRYDNWAAQLLVWNFIALSVKGLVLGFQMALNTVLLAIGEFLLSWIQPYPVAQLLLVIVLIPVITNAIAFWIQDNFLKGSRQNTIPLLSGDSQPDSLCTPSQDSGEPTRESENQKESLKPFDGVET